MVASLIIEHTVNFALSGNSHGPCNSGVDNFAETLYSQAHGIFGVSKSFKRKKTKPIRKYRRACL